MSHWFIRIHLWTRWMVNRIWISWFASSPFNHWYIHLLYEVWRLLVPVLNINVLLTSKKVQATPWYKYCRFSIRMPIVNIWRLWDRLIFVMGILVLTIPHIHIETARIVSCKSNCLRESFHQSHTIYLFLYHWYMVLVSVQFIIFLSIVLL